MARLNGVPRAVNPIPSEPLTPADIEGRKLAQARVGRTYGKAEQATARSSITAVIAGNKVSGGGRTQGGVGFKPESVPLRTKP